MLKQCLLHSLPQLPSNSQNQIRRLLPHVGLKTPYAQTPHPLNQFNLMTPRSERRTASPPHPGQRKRTSRFLGFPNPRPLGLRIRVFHLSRTRHLTYLVMNNSYLNTLQLATTTTPTPTQTFRPLTKRQRRRRRFSFFFGTSLPSKRGAGWGGGAQRARGNEINTATT